jgi:hypothetical protein
MRLSVKQGGAWAPAEVDPEAADHRKAVEALRALLAKKAWSDIADFDLHLDDPSLDWTNSYVSKLMS